MKTKYVALSLITIAAVAGIVIYVRKNKKEEEKSNVQSQSSDKKARKCWKAGPHGMVQVPCAGNSDKS